MKVIREPVYSDINQLRTLFEAVKSSSPFQLRENAEKATHKAFEILETLDKRLTEIESRLDDFEERWRIYR